MLKITVPESRIWNPSTEEFMLVKETTLVLEHSLVSLSKWEMKYKRPFLNQKHTSEEIDDYIRCMTLTQNVNPMVYYVITPGIRNQVRDYMEDPMTAAVVREDPQAPQSTKFITSDLIYYWMVALQIPFDPCQKWHLNRLLILIKITNIEQKPKKKQNPADIARQHHAINAARRAGKKR